MKPIETISLFVSNPIQEDTPEVYSITNLFIDGLRQSRIDVRINLKNLSVQSLHDSAALHSDLIITIGHGRKDGKLIFEKETKYGIIPESLSYSSLDQTAQSVFFNAQAVLICACYGAAWCASMPESVSWISFDEKILQRATTVFIQRILDYSGESILTSIQKANKIIEFTSVDSITFSKQDPHHYPYFKEGENPCFITVSPHIAGKSFLDSLEIEPTTESFHGRKMELTLCTNPPSGRSQLPAQRVTWIYGEAGMGKSALIKKTYEYLAHHWYGPAQKPPVILCINMRKVTSIEHAENRINDFICREILPDCRNRDRMGSCKLNDCFHNLSKNTGPFTLILDDLTYIDMTIKPENASQLVRILLDLAKVNIVSIHIIVTCRNKTNYNYLFLHLEKLTTPDLFTILHEMFPKKIGSPEKIATLFAQVQFNTFRFFALIARQEKRIDDIIKAMLRGHKRIRMVLEQIDRDLIKQEWEYGPILGEKKGINWPGFLLTLYPLSIQIGSFHKEQYCAIFGNFVSDEHNALPAGESVEEALSLAEIKGFLHVSDNVYSITPGKRHLLSVICTFEDAQDRMVAIKELLNNYCSEHSISFKDIIERRIRFCEEIAKTDGLMAIAAIKALEDDYSSLITKDPHAARAVAFSKRVNAEICDYFKEQAAQQEIIDQLIKEFGDHPAGQVVEQVASALFNQTENLWQEDRKVEYHRYVTALADRYGDHSYGQVVEQVAKALFNQTEKLWKEDRKDEYHQYVTALADRYGDHSYGQVVEQVAKALVNQTEKLWKEDRKEEYHQYVTALADRYGDHSYGQVVEQVAKALFNQTEHLWQEDRKEEYHQYVTALADRYGDHSYDQVVEKVAKALVNQTEHLWQEHRKEEYHQRIQQLVEKYGDSQLHMVVAFIVYRGYQRCTAKEETELQEYYADVLKGWFGGIDAFEKMMQGEEQ